ncbi:MAG: hypothetical protein A2X61_12840 [Ignavibacteria bacterium GWB2_35_12]|nr:MAG: hypothetical protein A2X63_03795 [Ignavibacteria bacterium GWA2_35_8]OGU41511.1 MAG: hypothetical protein A2X61_12840 [Ignavibacteria bacterium GWB2_35_12]OGU92998.1 MAG: hypothetical protein A2220_15765 [Ignavibacteria bacterium RIFOXYA2_FULL_35_10]OGV22985.1 MAG: hypothetical protein A2475_10310 [Ignavibacteria bacterium RIFOXYC2_FULL_35_21]
MSNAELKEKLIDKVRLTTDAFLLREAILLLDPENENVDIYKLNEKEREAIIKGIKEIEVGNYLTNDQANKEIEEWLNV